MSDEAWGALAAAGVVAAWFAWLIFGPMLAELLEDLEEAERRRRP